MPLFTHLKDAAAQSGLRFLVIGGHAVIEHGFQRGTEDADILVCKEDGERWREIALLPDWSGHRAHRSHIPNDDWRAYCRSNLPKIRLRPGFKENRRQHGIPVAFSL